MSFHGWQLISLYHWIIFPSLVGPQLIYLFTHLLKHIPESLCVTVIVMSFLCISCHSAQDLLSSLRHSVNICEQMSCNVYFLKIGVLLPKPLLFSPCPAVWLTPLVTYGIIWSWIGVDGQYGHVICLCLALPVSPPLWGGTVPPFMSCRFLSLRYSAHWAGVVKNHGVCNKVSVINQPKSEWVLGVLSLVTAFKWPLVAFCLCVFALS